MRRTLSFAQRKNEENSNRDTSRLCTIVKNEIISFQISTKRNSGSTACQLAVVRRQIDVQDARRNDYKPLQFESYRM